MSPMQDGEEGGKGPAYFDWGLNMHEVDGSTDLSMDLDDEGVTLPLPLFDLHDLPSSNGGWSDSDDEDLWGKVKGVDMFIELLTRMSLPYVHGSVLTISSPQLLTAKGWLFHHCRHIHHHACCNTLLHHQGPQRPGRHETAP